ncbi:MAG: UDP-N-acetylmuramoyl-L-alanine--D-glutamate ligase [Methylobacteriaceae bacterium]|nr:UDP-N-acetylmuramoyl-L-alanine--D-glutamate ligase [Methylobacteriaceae bacterium]
MTPVTSFAGKTVALFGLGGSGLATARALVAGGARVVCWDDSAMALDKARRLGLEVQDLGTANWSWFASFVLTPGVPLTHPRPHWTVEKAKAAGVEIIGDIELFCRERAKLAPHAPLIAITGTNGKSTTTALTAHILRTAGKDVQLGGNIGTAILALEPPSSERIHVIEVSSFQIDLAPSLAPTIGVLLNLTPDHLDRHGTMENYAAVKERLVANASIAALSVDDAWCRAIADRLKSRSHHVTRFSGEVAEGFHTVGTRILEGGNSRTGAIWLADVAGIASLRGQHNAQNAIAATSAVRMLHHGLKRELYRAALESWAERKGGGGKLAEVLDRDKAIVEEVFGDLVAKNNPDAWLVRIDMIQHGLSTFPGLPHRMEEVGRNGRVLFINDSKATNADAAEKALLSFRNIFWIAGGKAKEGGIEPLKPLFNRIDKAYLIGAATEEFAGTLGSDVPFERGGTLDVAVAHAAEDAMRSTAPEPIVLLSPACASYDQFPNFEVRGDRFRELVRGLPGVTPTGAAR